MRDSWRASSMGNSRYRVDIAIVASVLVPGCPLQCDLGRVMPAGLARRPGQGVPRVAVTWIGQCPSGGEIEQLLPASVGLQCSRLQKCRLTLVTLAPECNAIYRMDAARFGLLHVPDPFNRHGEIRSFPRHAEEGEDADQTALSIEQSATRGALTECGGGADHHAAVVAEQVGHFTGVIAQVAPAIEAD